MALILEYFILHTLNEAREHLFAAVIWLKEHHAKHTAYGHYMLMAIICQSVNCEVKYELQSVCAVVPDYNVRNF